MGARVGQGRPFPPRAQPDAPLLPLRTQSTAETWRVPSSAWRRSSRGGHSREGSWLAGWSSPACAHLVPFCLTQECQPGPGERYAPRAAGPGKLSQPGSE